jgi:hypothetical protein
MSDASPRGKMPTDRLVESRRCSAPSSPPVCRNVTVTESYSLSVAEKRIWRVTLDFAPVQASGATTGAFPLLRPTSATVALDCGRARSLKEELAPPCAGLFFSLRRCFIGCQEKPRPLAGGASRSILLRGGLSTFLPNKAFAENLSTFLPSKANAGSGRWFPMP